MPSIGSGSRTSQTSNNTHTAPANHDTENNNVKATGKGFKGRTFNWVKQGAQKLNNFVQAKRSHANAIKQLDKLLDNPETSHLELSPGSMKSLSQVNNDDIGLALGEGLLTIAPRDSLLHQDRPDASNRSFDTKKPEDKSSLPDAVLNTKSMADLNSLKKTHPVVHGAIDRLLRQEFGNECAFLGKAKTYVDNFKKYKNSSLDLASVALPETLTNLEDICTKYCMLDSESRIAGAKDPHIQARMNVFQNALREAPNYPNNDGKKDTIIDFIEKKLDPLVKRTISQLEDAIPDVVDSNKEKLLVAFHTDEADRTVKATTERSKDKMI